VRLNFTGNPRGVQLVLLVLIALTLALAYCRRAKADESTFFAGYGAMYSGGHSGAQGVNVGIEVPPFELRLVTHGAFVLPDDQHVRANLGACATWVKGFRPLTIGWGACLFNHGDYVVGNSQHDDAVQLTAGISLRHLFTEHIYVELFHSSSGGATFYNRGRNWITLGARF
jgi:hypothetical protein